ncbi:MAG: hypothetical protein WCL49_12605 [bacterium]
MSVSWVSSNDWAVWQMRTVAWAGTLEEGLLHGWAMDETQSYAKLSHLLLKDPVAGSRIP